MSRRQIVASDRGGVALAEPAPGDRELLDRDGDDGEYAVDADDRPLIAPPPSSWLVVLTLGMPVGDVSRIPVHNGPTYPCTAWNIGITLLPAARGRGIGSRAQRLYAEHLFASTDLDRVQASTDVDNLAERRALEHAGFRHEGVLRGAQLRGGVRRDIALYGLLRSDL